MEVVRKSYFLEVDECPKTKRPLKERRTDEKGNLVEEASWNYHPEEMTLTRIKYYPEAKDTGAVESLATMKCLVSGIIFDEEYRNCYGFHRDDGDALITRNRRTGADEYRGRFLNGDEYEITPEGLFPYKD